MEDARLLNAMQQMDPNVEKDRAYIEVISFVQRTHTESHSQLTQAVAQVSTSIAVLSATVADLAKRQSEDRESQQEDRRAIVAGSIVMGEARGALRLLMWMLPAGFLTTLVVNYFLK